MNRVQTEIAIFVMAVMATSVAMSMNSVRPIRIERVGYE